MSISGVMMGVRGQGGRKLGPTLSLLACPPGARSWALMLRRPETMSLPKSGGEPGGNLMKATACQCLREAAAPQSTLIEGIERVTGYVGTGRPSFSSWDRPGFLHAHIY